MLSEAEELLQSIIPSLCDRFGVAHLCTQRTIATLVFLLEEAGKSEDAELWQYHLLQTQRDVHDATALPTGGLDLDALEEGRENSDEATASLVRTLLGFGTRRCVTVVPSDETSSTPFGANKGPEAPGSALSAGTMSAAESDVEFALQSFESSSDGTSSSSLKCLKAALRMLQERRGREETGTS